MMNMQWLEWLLTPWCLAVLGLCVGSFLNVVIHRKPQTMARLEREWALEQARALYPGLVELEKSAPAQALPHLTLSKPRSHCPTCQHPIAWYHNIPVISYLWLRGRCGACKKHISLRYPLIELITGALFVAVGWRFEAQPVALLWCAATATLIALAGIDWDTTLLPDELTLPLLWAGLISSTMGWGIALPSALWGAVVGYLSLWSIYWVFKLATGKEGMGYGDFKLLAALGAWLGWKMLLPIVLGASIIGALVGIVMKLTHTLRDGLHVPFGPFLAGSALVVMFAGSQRVRHCALA
jgi:leader peptidase (prepilin peptidase) / N-methyltransferase